MSKVIGQRVTRYDGMAHVTGETKFVDDQVVPGTLTVKALRSPVSKGKVKNLDISAAEKMPGVAGVITAADVPCNAFGLVPDQPVLVNEDIRYRGEVIAAVAAVDEDTAMEALEKIGLDIEEQQAVLDPLEAMKEGAPQVRPEGNLQIWDGHGYRQVNLGDVDQSFDQADEIVESTHLHPSVEHAPMEPICSLAVPHAGPKLTVYTVSQALYFHLGMLCGILQMEPGDVHCKQWKAKTGSSWRHNTGYADLNYVGGTVGGGFGGKNDIMADHVAALLALKTGRPCKWRWTRAEDLLYSTFRGAWHITIKDAVTKDGRIIGRQMTSIRDAGSYASLNPYVVEKHCYLGAGPYFIPNVRVRGYCVYTNKPPASSMRGFGITPAAFATEVQLDKIADRLGMDPWEVRLTNAFRKGEYTPTKRVLNSVAMIEVLQNLAAKAGVELPGHLKAMASTQERG
ncbi:MAG: molybdopterin-dependent oxidoreductase [Proteobacteria bacterium]|nr:molybdopterin-dependent oxidoreductase [Pseudomonadota bacterium]MBU4383657.1 molybdopterin-dependent oxidoreductase [Pseudomonadota bacterium]MBU4606338.1 molybdopterin-dependent oxidoreductase [Pseudomonadota bacterium]